MMVGHKGPYFYKNEMSKTIGHWWFEELHHNLWAFEN
jgi:hypothetical protein